MKEQIKEFWQNIDTWNFDQLCGAYQLITDGIGRCRDEMLMAGMSDFARRSLGQSIQIQGNMLIALKKRMKVKSQPTIITKGE